MRILLAHNYYQQTGGEDVVVEAEAALLGKCGHKVERYSRHNDELIHISASRAALGAVWSVRTSTEVSGMIHRFKPDIIHVHNTFPLISPSLYWAAGSAAIPVVQTLHNFRLMCLNAMFLRAGRVCEDCLGRWPWHGVANKCYRESFVASAVLAGMLTMHRTLGTYRHRVTRYIALNEFCRKEFIEGGLPAERIVVKPNFVDCHRQESSARSGFLFVGRLSREKGVRVLADAARAYSGISIRVAGAGPEAKQLSDIPGITVLGMLSQDEVREEMNRARALVMPSLWYENFPRTIVEAFACSLPVITSRIGALAELVEDGMTGLLFEPGSGVDLAEKLRWVEANPDQIAEMGRQARAEYEAKYTPEKNYEQLITIYEDAIRTRRYRHDP